jgi:putative ABC transport system substrate-binding protein
VARGPRGRSRRARSSRRENNCRPSALTRIVSDPLFVAHIVRINMLAIAARLPTMYSWREAIDAGGLMSYAPNYPNLWRRAAELTDKILRGTKPGDIPVEQPTKFDLIVNMITAKLLGLEVPPMLFARADEVIE